jgi:hypothetical protein
VHSELCDQGNVFLQQAGKKYGLKEKKKSQGNVFLQEERENTNKPDEKIKASVETPA